jgi:hypothetical protein
VQGSPRHSRGNLPSEYGTYKTVTDLSFQVKLSLQRFEVFPLRSDALPWNLGRCTDSDSRFGLAINVSMFVFWFVPAWLCRMARKHKTQAEPVCVRVRGVSWGFAGEARAAGGKGRGHRDSSQTRQSRHDSCADWSHFPGRII